MAVDIQFTKVDSTPISLDKTTGGIDFGVVRKNQYQITPVIVKNNGTNDAKNVYVSGSTLHTPTEVTTDAYNNEILASKWQTFSMLPDGDFTTTLSLPNILAGQTMLGKKKLVELFTNPTNSGWKNDSLTGHNYNWTGNSVIVTDTAGTGKIFGYMTADGWGNNKEVDVTYTFMMPATTTTGAAFVMFGLRKNCLGDNKGYLLNVKRTAPTSGVGGTMFCEIRKGAGSTSATTGDYGTVLGTSTAVTYADFQPIRIKLFTNSNNLPELKVWIGNVKDSDTPLTWGTGTTATQSWVDTANTYPYAGLLSINFGDSGTGIVAPNQFEIKSASLLTDDSNGKVYIRTLVGDGAVDNVTYNSAMELYYDPV